MIKAQMSCLELVHQPLSNQEAVWAPNDPELVEILKRSDFYMIGGRMSGVFSDFQDEGDDIYKFNFRIGKGTKHPVQLNLRELPGLKSYYFKKDMLSPSVSFETWNQRIVMEEGPEWISFWSGKPKAQDSIQYEWFTTERLLWLRSHAYPGIIGLDNHRELSTFDLLYVGIATDQDSYERLIKKGHHARQKILSNERQRYPGARVTDETFLFLFKVNPLVTKVWTPDEKVTVADLGGDIDFNAIVADAEKAFVSLLKPEYNVVKFTSYPKGKDGLYGSDFDRYGYMICENICFNTAHGKFHGAYDPITHYSNEGDFIFVAEKQVTFYRSGVDFPADYGTRSTEKKAETGDFIVDKSPDAGSEQSVKIFAYGSSLDLDQMRSRCPSVTVVARGRVPGYELIFPRTSAQKDRQYADGSPGGVASIRPTNNGADLIEGVVYLIKGKADEDSLDQAEGVNINSYSKQPITVDLENGTPEDCLTYIANALPGGPFLPSRQYKSQIVEGARSHGLSPEYRARLDEIEAVD